MGIEDIGKPRSAYSSTEVQTQYQDEEPEEQQQSRFVVPQDRGYGNFNEAMMINVLESGIPDNIDFNNYEQLYMAVVNMLGKIPNYNRPIQRALYRKFVDIQCLATCQGTTKRVNTRMKNLMFEIRSYVPIGDLPLVGMTGVSSIVTTRQQVEQTLKATHQPLPERKKIFGVF